MNLDPDLPDVEALIAGATAAHRRLWATVAPITDEVARQPSLLPGWSVGHVLTHLSRNADSQTWVLEGALAGEQRHQYPGGPEQRTGDIEAGSGRPAAELVADVRAAIDRLEATWAAMTPEAWRGGGFRSGGGEWPAAQSPYHRWREVEVHHSDLGLGYSPADWVEDYVAVELPRQLSIVPHRLAPEDRRALLAWLLGRDDQPALNLQSAESLPFKV